MPRTPLALTAALLLAGCASSPTPTSTSTPISATAQTSPPIQATLVAYTASPSATPTASPTQVPTAAPIASPTPRDELFTDPILDEASGWQQLNVKNATFAFIAGELASTYVKKGSWAYAAHDLAQPETTVRVDGTFTSSGSGYFGWLCGDSATGRYYGAVPQTDGSLVFIAGGYGGVEPLERYDNLGVPLTNGARTRFGLECVIDHGELWLEAFLGDDEPIAVHDEDDVVDVSHFDVLGMYGESLDPPFTMSVSDITAYGVGGSAGTMSVPDAALIQGVAGSLAADCASTSGSVGADASVDCFIQDEGAGPEMLELTGYPDTPSMQAAYSGGTGGTACVGAPPTSWTNGDVRCVAQTAGVRIEWTDDRSNVVGRLVDFDGDVAATDSAWSAITAGD